MSETRRDALKISVLAAIGLTEGCLPPPAPGAEYVPFVSSQPDRGSSSILINTGQGFGWALLQPNADNTFHASSNKRPISGTQPDLGAVTADQTLWQDWSVLNGNNPIPVYGTGISVRVTNSTVTQSDLQAVVGQPGVAQHAWNEIGKQ